MTSPEKCLTPAAAGHAMGGSPLCLVRVEVIVNGCELREARLGHEATAYSTAGGIRCPVMGRCVSRYNHGILAPIIWVMMRTMVLE